jgi:hypothetical protein
VVVLWDMFDYGSSERFVAPTVRVTELVGDEAAVRSLLIDNAALLHPSVDQLHEPCPASCASLMQKCWTRQSHRLEFSDVVVILSDELYAQYSREDDESFNALSATAGASRGEVSGYQVESASHTSRRQLLEVQLLPVQGECAIGSYGTAASDSRAGVSREKVPCSDQLAMMNRWRSAMDRCWSRWRCRPCWVALGLEFESAIKEEVYRRRRLTNKRFFYYAVRAFCALTVVLAGTVRAAAALGKARLVCARAPPPCCGVAIGKSHYHRFAVVSMRWIPPVPPPRPRPPAVVAGGGMNLFGSAVAVVVFVCDTSHMFADGVLRRCCHGRRSGGSARSAQRA